MASLEKYLGSKCEIKTMQNDLLAVGVINQVQEDRLYLVSNEKNETVFMPLIPYKSRVKIVIFNSKIGTVILSGIVYLSNKEFLCLAEVQKLSDFEKRDYFRVNVAMHTAIIISDPETQAKHTHAVDIKDLSLSGAAFYSRNLNLKPGQHLELLIRLDERGIYFPCIIMRAMEPTDDVPHYFYGCHFIDPTNEMTTALCAYLFRQQSLQIKKRRLSANPSTKD